jgi:3'-phosphoadenosine 5'-phosphosulfate sulfotransferase (PAPS reductase)/FAD synthetase
MSLDLIDLAMSKRARLFVSVSGGKDGQAMAEAIYRKGIPVECLIHCDLGRVEWPESMPHCLWHARHFGWPLHIVRRSDGKGLLEYWKQRMLTLKGTGIPFWSNKKNRYCTSGMKAEPTNVFLTGTGLSFMIVAQGIRAAESKERAKKAPLSIRVKKSSTFYQGMTVEEAIHNFRPDCKLTLDWYPIFNWSVEDVWSSFGMSTCRLLSAREEYRETGIVPAWWPFHPAYVYGNDRVSCRFCVLGSQNDLQNGAAHDHDGLLDEMIRMEVQSGATFKDGWSLTTLRQPLLNSKPSPSRRRRGGQTCSGSQQLPLYS